MSVRRERSAYHREWRRTNLVGDKLEAERARKREVARQAGWTASRRASCARRRAEKMQLPNERVNPFDIFDRDGWRCHICQEPIDETLCWPHPLSASIDHVIPLSAGGTHTALNIRAAHACCNISKGNTVDYGQLSLVLVPSEAWVASHPMRRRAWQLVRPHPLWSGSMT